MDKLTLDKPILLVAFHSFAGMGPYVISIINSFECEDNIRFFLIEKDDRYYSKNIKEELRPKATIIQIKSSSKLNTLISVITRFKCKYARLIEQICNDENISLIHDLTGCIDYQFIKKISHKYNWLYTVHDLYPHESKKSFFKEFRQRKIYKSMFKAISYADRLLTNSVTQYDNLKKYYPAKPAYYIPFPSLITKTIQQGSCLTPELIGITKYILFFGRIEEYKGLSILLKAFNNVDTDIKLVIAGNGELPYPIDSSRVIFINRYIDDGEIKSLYKNSLFVIYPYLSATQSGVLAVASYFEKPIIASDIPFFIEILGVDYIGLFKNRDIKDLTDKINFFIQMPNESMDILRSQMADLYKKHYEIKNQRIQLLSIYKNSTQ